MSSKGLSANAWLIRGWCYLAMARISEASESFAKAMNSSCHIRTDAVYGRALSLLRVRFTDDAEALLNANPLSAKQDRELRSEIYFQRARAAFDHKQYARVITALDARQKIVTEPRDMSLMRAWAYHHLGYSPQANELFRRLNTHIRGNYATQGAEITNTNYN